MPFLRTIIVLLIMLTLPYIALADQEQGDSAKAAGGILNVQVTEKGANPLANGIIFLFNDSMGPYPSMEKYWRVPDIVEMLDQDGKLSIEIPAGKYYLIASRRVAGLIIGPPVDGEQFYFETDQKGNPKPISVVAGKKTDIGLISTAIPFKKNNVSYIKGITAAEGVVVDIEGRPVEGVFILAFPIPDTQERPLYVSEMTGRDGKFLLRTGEGGTYNIKVRSFYGGGRPEEAEIFNINGPNELTPVTLQKGEKTTGVTLKVGKFPKRRRK